VSSTSPSWRPTAWQARFIASLEPRIGLEGHDRCGKQRCLIEAAAVGVDDPLWRAVIITIGAEAKADLVRATERVYSRAGATYAAQFSEWRWSFGATVRLAGSLAEARGGAGYDMVCLEHIEEFRHSEIPLAFALRRNVPGRKARVRMTRRIDRDWRRYFPARITFDDGEGEPVDEGAIEESTDLERLVLALTAHLHRTGGASTWDAVRDAVHVMAPGPHDAETSDLVKAVEARDGDEQRLLLALDRARHHLAEMQGAGPGACHPTCAPSCSLRQYASGWSVDVTPR
jgi:hypothetical protein